MDWLPISVGVSTSKTLAKLTNHCAKKRPEFRGVCDFSSIPELAVNHLMSQLPNIEIWGIGKKLVQRLHDDNGLKTVLDLKGANPEVLRRQYSIVMEKTIRDLNAIACIELEQIQTPKKQIISSRSFGIPVSLISKALPNPSPFISAGQPISYVSNNQYAAQCICILAPVHFIMTKIFTVANQHQQ